MLTLTEDRLKFLLTELPLRRARVVRVIRELNKTPDANYHALKDLADQLDIIDASYLAALAVQTCRSTHVR